MFSAALVLLEGREGASRRLEGGCGLGRGGTGARNFVDGCLPALRSAYARVSVCTGVFV